jgi:tRNA (adenine57-N1/adenine58-N1)-methyltransferase catalytic subunit
LDLHPSGLADNEKLEILEAGTGHGALTLHLARAIVCANGPAPSAPLGLSSPVDNDLEEENGSSQHALDNAANAQVAQLENWKKGRKAIIHTLDISPKHSKHAQKTILAYRHGLYHPHTDFHSGSLSEFLSLRAPESFAHCFLDLPSCENYLKEASDKLQTDGCLMVFTPSISQVAVCVELIKNENLPLVMEQCVELGPGLSGGRLWDVRAVRPRALEKLENGAKLSPQLNGNGLSGAEIEPTSAESEEAEQPISTENTEEKSASDYKMVCRPKVGERTQGGGFLGVWRKMKRKEE